MSRAGGAAVLATAAAAAMVAAIALHWPQPARSGDPVCGALDRLVAAMDLTSLGDQAELRARAAELADTLLSISSADASGSDEDPAGGGRAGQAGQVDAGQAGRAIALVLSDPMATVDDLATAIAPVVTQCRLREQARSD